MDELKAKINDFIIGQIANAESPQAAKLALAIRDAIRQYKEAGGENHHAFSVGARYEDGEFVADVDFDESNEKIIMYYAHTDDETVDALYECGPEAEHELARLAGLMLSEGWVDGYRE